MAYQGYVLPNWIICRMLINNPYSGFFLLSQVVSPLHHGGDIKGTSFSHVSHPASLVKLTCDAKKSVILVDKLIRNINKINF